MKKYSIIYMAAVGSGGWPTYVPKLLRITTGNINAFLKNNPYYDDVHFIFEGHVVHAE